MNISVRFLPFRLVSEEVLRQCMTVCALYCSKTHFLVLPEWLSCRERLPSAVNVLMRFTLCKVVFVRSASSPPSFVPKISPLLTRKFVLSWKNPLGSKWFSVAYTAKGHICALYFLAPFFVPKVSPSLNPKKCALSWKIPERSSTFGAGLDLCLIAEFSNKPVWPFPPSSPSPLFARLLERSREFLNRVCQIGRLPANHGAPGVSTRWACASQPGFPPLRAQFRFGVTTDWSRFRFSV